MAASDPDSQAAAPAGSAGPTVAESAVIAGVYVVTPKSFPDERGRFIETYRRSWFPGGREMVQGNRSDKKAGSVVGLHYHLRQADYWYVPAGRCQVILHDLREGSPTDGATLNMEIGDHSERGVYIPPGVAHGFASLTDMTITYMVDQYYSPDDELGVAWDDPDIAAEWAVAEPIVSARDRQNPLRAEIPRGLRPLMGEVFP